MKRPRRGSGRNWLGAVLILVAFAALAALTAGGLLLRPPPTDPDTLCRTDQPLAAHAFILVDGTDKLEARHRRKLQAVVRQEGQRLAPNDRLTIASIRADRPQEPRILFSLCNPGDGRSANPLFQNTRQAQARWDAAFGEALDRTVRRAAAGRGAAASPILAGLRAVAADPDFGADIPRRRLVLVSDLLEYAPGGFSLYADGATYGAWRARTSAPPPDLDGVDMRIVMLDRPANAAAQSAARDGFWPAYFNEAGVARVSFDPAP